MSSETEIIEEINREMVDLEVSSLPKKSRKKIVKRPKIKNESDSSGEDELESPELRHEIIPDPEPELPKKVERKEKKEQRQRPNADITYEAVIDGQIRSYKYRTPMLRAKFMDVQRGEYKKACTREGVQYINDMFSLISMWHWKTITKYYIGVDEDQITEPIDLLGYYKEQPQEIKDEIFRKKPYYKNYIK